MGHAGSRHDAARRAVPSRPATPPPSPSCECLAHPLRDLILGTRGVDHDVALRLCSGECQIAFAYAAIEADVFCLEAQFVASASACAAQAGLFIDVEERRLVRAQRARRPVVERAQPIEVDEPPEALVGERRVDIAIAEYDASRIE